MRLLIASSVAIGATIRSPAQDDKTPLASTEAVVRLGIGGGSDGEYLDLRLMKPEVVRKLIERPLRDAAADPHPEDGSRSSPSS